ncbi:MAG: VCBS repeat-containing protein [Clostridia bacterium]|nr:VCBS repeat-containing protein [Clostridia bacterium]
MKRLIVIPLILVLALASCDGAPEQTTAATTVTDVVTTEAPQTEAVPEDDLSPGVPELSDNFAFAVAYREPVTENTIRTKTTVGQTKLTIDCKSTFYGSESLVKRDTHVFGYLFKMTRQTGNFPVSEGYYFADFNGDRLDDMATFADGTLRIYASAKKSTKYNDNSLCYSQKLSFSGALRGTGDFNGDGFSDLLFYTGNGRAVIGYGKEDGFDYVSAGFLPSPFELDASMIAAGDVNGDGMTDVVAVNGYEYASFTVGGETSLYHADRLLIEDGYRLWCTGDVNCDGVCDLVTVIGDKQIRTYYGKTDGTFGPDKDDPGNVNLYPTGESERVPAYITSGDLNGDGNKDVVFSEDGKPLMFYLTFPPDFPAYDYSTHIIKTDGGYILYNGGRYTDYDKEKYGYNEGDHVLVYLSGDGVIWHRSLDAPAFYLGGELGVTNEWWSGNTIEPEVIFVDGTYYMYWQCENYKTYKGALIGADRIGYATSTDGIHFERHTERPVIVNDPEYIGYDHEEAIYVKDDPDGKCFWLYVRATVNNGSPSFIRIRSADPATFDYGDLEKVSGFSQLGNQIGYLTLDNGIRLFIRITFSGSSPVLQISADGLEWKTTGMLLSGVSPDADTDRKNCYFCGFSTINGTGEIERSDDGTYTFIYGTCCSKSPVAPDIFYANVGRGTCRLKITVG